MVARFTPSFLFLLTASASRLGLDLSSALASLRFLNNGTIQAGLPDTLKGLETFYLETENVTAPGSWGGPNPFP